MMPLQLWALLCVVSLHSAPGGCVALTLAGLMEIAALLQEDEVQGETYNLVLPDDMQADKEAGKLLEANTVEGPHVSGMFGIAFSAISSVAATGDPCLSCLSKGYRDAFNVLSCLLNGLWYICCASTSDILRHRSGTYAVWQPLLTSLRYALHLSHKQPKSGTSGNKKPSIWCCCQSASTFALENGRHSPASLSPQFK